MSSLNSRKSGFNKIKPKSMYCIQGEKIKRQSGIVRGMQFFACDKDGNLIGDKVYQIGSNAFPQGKQAKLCIIRKQAIMAQIECIGEAVKTFPSAKLPLKVRSKILDMLSNSFLAQRSRTKAIAKPRVKINPANVAQRSLIRAKFNQYV